MNYRGFNSRDKDWMHMKTNELEEQLWDFVYGLLPENECVALRERITSEPDVARAYAEVMLQAELLGEAARMRAPTLKLKRPRGDGKNQAIGLKRAKTATALNWVAGLAAALLLCVVGYSYVKPQSPLRPETMVAVRRQLTENQVQTLVYGPRELQPTLANFFTISTRSLDGKPQSVPVNIRFLDDNQVELANNSGATDANGFLQVSTPKHLKTSQLHVQVQPTTAANVPPVLSSLPVGEDELTTHITTDKPLYRPGETVRYRSLTLSRFGLKARREVAIDFRIVKPDGSVLKNSEYGGVTERGVGNGEMPLAPNTTGGKYKLFANSPDGEFEEAHFEFFVRRYRAPRLKKKLEFVHDSYGPGDEVVADFSVERAEGGAVPDATLKISAMVDGESVHQQTAAAVDGTYRARFRLPESIERGTGNLAVTVADGVTETIAKPIPINLGTFDVAFYAEGGDLTAGLDNHVYFHAASPQGKPVHIQADVVDDAGDRVATLETFHEGRGHFNFTPDADQLYRLQINSPAGASRSITLPPVAEQSEFTLHAVNPVAPAGESLKLEVGSQRNEVPLVATVVCRGTVVGQRNFATAAMKSVEVNVPLAKEAEGVSRVTVYNYETQPPQPIAERLVFRQPARKLNIRVDDDKLSKEPRDTVDLTLRVHDERDEPVSAALGVTVVDDSILTLADNKSPRMTTHYWLTSEIEKPSDLEDANFFLTDDEKAPKSLDMLLGTQGWRRFAKSDPRLLAENSKRSEVADQLADDFVEGETRVEDEFAAAPVLLVENSVPAKEAIEKEVTSQFKQREADLNRVGNVLLVGALAVLFALLVMATLNMSAGAKVWAPTLAGAVCCLLVGFFWSAASINVRGEISWMPDYSVGRHRTTELAQSESKPKQDTANADVTLSESSNVEPEANRAGTKQEDTPAATTRQLNETTQAVEQSDTFRDAAPSSAATAGAVAEKPIDSIEQDVIQSAPEPTATVRQQVQARNRAELKKGIPKMQAMPSATPRGGRIAFDESEGVAADAVDRRAFKSPHNPATEMEFSADDLFFNRQDGLRRRLKSQSEPSRAPLSEESKDKTVEPQAAMSRGAAPRNQPATDAKVSPGNFPKPPSKAGNARPAEKPTVESPENAAAAGFGGGGGNIVEQDSKLARKPAPQFGSRGVAVPYRKKSEAKKTSVDRVASDSETRRQLTRATFPRREYAHDNLPRRGGIQTDFSETVYWNPLLITDEKGEAKVQFTLPDSETTFRVLADGHADGRIGSDGGVIISRQPAASSQDTDNSPPPR